MAASPDDILSNQQSATQYLGLIYQALKAAFGFIGGTSATAVGGAATLPANPVGFITMTLPSGQSVKVPYYT